MEPTQLARKSAWKRATMLAMFSSTEGTEVVAHFCPSFDRKCPKISRMTGRAKARPGWY